MAEQLSSDVANERRHLPEAHPRGGMWAMAYRDESDALRARIGALEADLRRAQRELARAKSLLRVMEGAGDNAERMRSELARTRGELALAKWKLERTEQSPPPSAEEQTLRGDIKALGERLKVTEERSRVLRSVVMYSAVAALSASVSHGILQVLEGTAEAALVLPCGAAVAVPGLLGLREMVRLLTLR